MEGFGSYYTATLKSLDAACDAVTVALVLLVGCYGLMAVVIGWHVRKGIKRRKGTA